MRLTFVLAASVLTFVVSGCGTTKSCTLLSCDSRLTVQYAQPPQGPYTLAVSTTGFNATVSCPTSSRDGDTFVSLDGGYASLEDGGAIPPDTTPTTLRIVLASCTTSGFELRWDGDHSLGTNASDSAEIAVMATVTPSGSGATPPTKGTASAMTSATNQPNGAECGPTCYTRQATLSLR